MTIREPLPRLILNFGLWCLIFWLFTQIGWLTVSEATPLWLVLIISGVASTLVGVIVLLILALISLIPCLGAAVILVLSPFITYGILYATGQITGLYSMTTVWWQMIVIGLVFGFMQFRAPSEEKGSSSRSFSRSFKPLERPQVAYATQPESQTAVASSPSRWAGTLEVKSETSTDKNRCTHCGRGLSRKKDACGQCGAPNINYEP